MPLTQSQRHRTEETSPDFSAGRKLSEMEQALLWSVLQEEPECPSRVLLDKAAERQIVITVSLRHVNRWRLTWGLNRGQGRRFRKRFSRAESLRAWLRPRRRRLL